ncbi:TonB-dependent receptor [Pedobacter sp. ASV28]|uniref:TonB-dependent receptor n=1 Tax=Pedobacter sp. ASV28 TaxID=2795123 RepID=UPI0018EB9A63|nr:carboxypeptidase regulatory-like domain-containing protein [Pedobacter sp. ASV28]
MKKSLLLKIVSIVFVFVGFIGVANAQVTSSTISGTIRDSKETLPGASIKATHVPSGTVYTSVSNKDGLFNITGMRVGGPYTVEVTYMGYEKSTQTDIVLSLGQPYTLNVVLSSAGTVLQTVNISGVGTKSIVTQKQGASTNVNRTALATLPSFSRSITDFTRLTPQSTGTSFAGRDARLNSVTVDGANLNNTFGTSAALLPGGTAQPISIETYDELSINIAPFDVRQSGFTGAGIYATTKSGTNTFHGSAYTYYKDQSFNGTMIGDYDISSSVSKASTKTYGFTVGGPIIKNKLFFFGNYEREESTSPGIAFFPTGGTGTGTQSATTVTDLIKVSDYLRNNYGYETGRYDNFPAFQEKNYKILAKVDWNINDKNKLTVKYSYLNATNDQTVNSQSTPNNASHTWVNTVTNVTGSRTNLVNGRYSINSIAFENSNYGFLNKVTTVTAELNSKINSKLSNQLLFTMKKYDNPRTTKGDLFPTIDIYNGLGNNYITAGSDPYTKNNEVIDNTTSIYNNLTYYAGKHTLTAGINYEFQRVGNAYMPGAAGSYIYNSLDDFLNDRAPIQFTYNYSLVPGVDKVFSANLKVGTLSLYAQDEFAVNENFKMTFGLRADKGIYLENPLENPQMTALMLPDANGNLKSYNSGAWPKSRILLSPRFGFRANLLDDKSLVFRGGMGIFTGRIPYVYLTNSPSNTAMYNFGGVATAAQLQNIKLVKDPSVYANLFPQIAGTAVQSATVVIDENFKFPQIFRANLALDKNLGDGFSASFEGLFTKDINATRMRNANLKAPTGVLKEGDLTRVRYVGTGTNGAVTANDRAFYPNLNSVIALENTNKGYATSLTGQINKAFSGGFNASLAYTYTQAKEAFATAGSTAGSVWATTNNVGTTNDVELGYTQFYVPHRVVANFSYKIDYLNHGATTFGLFFQGQAGGTTPISYTVNGDLNGDANSSDLMYIPRNASEMNFTQYTATVNGVGYTYTKEQQAAAFEQFINNTPYLKKNRGKYAQRNAAFLPWYNRIDANILQDFYIKTGNTKHTLQLSAVVVNLPNLLSKYWGIQKIATYNNPITYLSTDANGVPSYNMRNLDGKLVTQPFRDATTASTTWSLLIGAKYIF